MESNAIVDKFFRAVGRVNSGSQRKTPRHGSKAALIALFIVLAQVAPRSAWSQSVIYTFGPDVPIDQQQTVRDAITLGHQFFQTRLGTTVQGTTSAFVFASPERLVDAYMEFLDLPAVARPQIMDRFKDCGNGEAGFGWLFQCAGGDGWNIAVPSNISLRDSRISKILHEYNHVLQFDLAGPQPGCCPSNEVPSMGPVWLFEGAAQYLHFVLFDDEGIRDLRSVMEGERNSSGSVSALRNFETFNGTFSEPKWITLGEVAVDVLALLNDLPALANFWRGIGTGATWQEAFEPAFGRTIDEFYVEFEEIRNRNFDDLDLDGMDDEFENRFGLNPKDPDDADLDNDGDGTTNLEEFQAGTNPNVNESAVNMIINTILVGEE